MRMTKEDEEEFQKANECHICNKIYTNEDIKVRDHCHITGKYRGSAHQECNLKLRVNPEEIKIPVIFHNLRGYDSHFIMQEIGAIVKKHIYKNKKGEDVALATKDETSRGVAKACLLSVAVGTILQVVEQNHEKPR